MRDASDIKQNEVGIEDERKVLEMKALNLLLLARMSEYADAISDYEKYVSGRKESLKVKSREIATVNQFVQQMQQNGVDVHCFDGFFYSFSIPQISKEFDLLKINDNRVLNIELKSGSVPTEKIQRQLIQNKHYLSHLSREVWLYAYVQETGCVYTLNGGDLQEITVNEMANTLKRFGDYISAGLEKLFVPSMYLISPINDPEQFWAGAYFLTDGQEKIRNPIIAGCRSRTKHEFFSISGAAGTGKSLLLYDIAKNLAAEEKVCIIHCGMLSDGHSVLNSYSENLSIISAKSIDRFDFSPFSYILIDEAHRIYKRQLVAVIETIKTKGMACVFSSDSHQVLSQKELRSDICGILSAMNKEHQFSLTEKIRSNREMASFIKKLFDLNTQIPPTEFENVEIAAAHDYDEAVALVEYYKARDYTYISYTMSQYHDHKLDCFISQGRNTHEVIGQEFDSVVMVIDDSFSYNEKGELIAKTHPNPDYLFKKLLFQGVTRARERLALIVIDSKIVMENLLRIVTEKT